MNMFRDTPRIGQQLLDVPMGQMIEQMAMSIAKSQMALDSNSIEVAEMMGGLSPVKYEKDGKEFINFKDSRVFFGKEKVSLAGAVELYNANTDQAYKASIEEKIKDDTEAAYDKPVVDVDVIPSSASAKFTPDNQKNASVYYRETSDPVKWYEYDPEASGGNGAYKLMPDPPTASTTALMVKPGAVEKTLYLPQRLSMLELGFSPTFYQFVDTMIQVRIAIKFSREGSSSYSYSRNTKSTDRSASFSWRKGLKTNKTVTTTQVNAEYSQKYSYSAEGSSLLQTKLVPIPPPAILEERIQQQMEIAREEAEN
ncbi:hypothetical protein [Tenacibaculum agarivorans]|uniref:hypothetical protein n=1 Tax=Tenacibaculum agarivorans TaxID=1908389 RepID=UPI000B184D87|nr:hypothetical protein [Tenacibaculum agarivorans]